MAIRVIALNRDVSSMSHCIEIISHSFSILSSVEYAHAYCLKICWDHSCGYSKSCPDGLVGLFRTKVVTGHVGPAP